MSIDKSNQSKNIDTDTTITTDSQFEVQKSENKMNIASSAIRMDTRDSVAFGIGFSTKMLSLLGVPFAAQVGQLWNFTLDTLWPKQDNTWNNLINFVEELIDKKIDNAVREKANSELEGLGNVLYLYQEALNDWQADPNNESKKEHVRTQFRITNSSFEQQIPSFAVKGHELSLLAIYVHAANLYLLLLRDCAIYGREWGFDPVEIDNTYKKQLDRTAKYTDHCTDWYSKGLNQLKGTNSQAWGKYNKYRREMTINILDICALFSNYDYHKYPVETKVELTRYIYSDAIPIGYEMSDWSWKKPLPYFSTVENLAIGRPNTIRWLNSLKIYTGKVNGFKGGSSGYWQAHEQTFSETIAGKDLTGDLYGRIKSSPTVSTVQLINKNIYSITSQKLINPWLNGILTVGISDATFKYDEQLGGGEKTYEYKGNNTINVPPTLVSTYLPGNKSDIPNVNDYSHVLTYLTGFEVIDSALILISWWTSTSVDRHNTLRENKITEIPSVKGHSINNCEIVKGSGSTGGDLLKVTNSKASFGLNVTPLVKQTYRMRVRYAASDNFTLNLNCKDADIQISMNVSKTGNIANDEFAYNLFSYVDIPIQFEAIPIKDSYKDYKFNITFPNTPANAKVYIDRFEFIPVTKALLEYEADRKIELKELKERLAEL